MERRERQGLSDEARGAKRATTKPTDRYPNDCGLNVDYRWLQGFRPVRSGNLGSKRTKKQREMASKLDLEA